MNNKEAIENLLNKLEDTEKIEIIKHLYKTILEEMEKKVNIAENELNIRKNLLTKCTLP